jgi:hypothetical protein
MGLTRTTPRFKECLQKWNYRKTGDFHDVSVEKGQDSVTHADVMLPVLITTTADTASSSLFLITFFL